MTNYSAHITGRPVQAEPSIKKFYKSRKQSNHMIP